MSRLQKFTKIVETHEEDESVPSDYAIQHPLASFRRPVAVEEQDHLAKYTEVRPFEDSEGLKSLKDKAKAKLLKRKMKKSAKKVHKEIDDIAKERKVIRKIRAKFKDKSLFDSVVTKKLDGEDTKIYKEAIN
mgnify:CR=1 FL=1